MGRDNSFGSSSSRLDWTGYQISFLMCPIPDGVARLFRQARQFFLKESR